MMSEDNLKSSNENEPQIDSCDPQERIQARQKRIQRRIEATKKRLQPIEEGESLVHEEEKTLVEKQVELSTVTLIGLLEEGKELVTNVQVACESYEVNRRVDEASSKQIRLKKLEDEAAIAQEKFEEINSKWSEIAGYNDPLDLNHETELQKEKCMELIAQKDKLINDLKTELKMADIRFVKDQVKQSEDISLLVSRIDNMVKIMKKSYRNELQLIEEAISIERQELLEVSNKRWEGLYKQREKDEVINLEQRFVAIDEHNEEMNKIMIDHQEKYRATKIRLEKDLQVLQQQLEQVKAMCLLDKEKMEYNYQVLKKREEESLLIRSQQKRRINKLQDSVTTLRRRIQTVEQSTIAEEKRLTTEVLKLHHNIKDIRLKAKHFATVNNNKYNQLWNFNHNRAKQLLDKILTIDQTIHEQHLGIPWKSPELILMSKSDMPSYRSAIEKIQSARNESKISEDKFANRRAMVINNRLMRYILKAIANSAGFLVEQKLSLLLEGYSEKEETLVRLDNVFSALGLKSDEDIEHLRKAFEPYVECKDCRSAVSSDSCLTSEHQIVAKPETDESKGLEKIYKDGDSLKKHEVEDTSSSIDSPVMDLNLPGMLQETSILESSICQNPNHQHYIEPSNVLKTLKTFVEDFKQYKEGKGDCKIVEKEEEHLETVSRLLNDKDVEQYWNKFRQMFSAEKEKLWDSLLIGLSKYHSILQERHKINKEVAHLKVQNSELRHLLQKYALPEGMNPSSNKNHEFLPPLSKSSSELHKMPVNLFLQLTENKKMAF
uniref:Dynein regulatory complex protein 1 n=1 Tax=Clastoptera arizonana TaxID=38151 RepID=A0A1B6E7F5_9HEMI